MNGAGEELASVESRRRLVSKTRAANWNAGLISSKFSTPQRLRFMQHARSIERGDARVFDSNFRVPAIEARKIKSGDPSAKRPASIGGVIIHRTEIHRGRWHKGGGISGCCPRTDYVSCRPIQHTRHLHMLSTCHARDVNHGGDKLVSQMRP